MSDSSRPHGLQPTRLLRPWDFPGKSTGVGCRIFHKKEFFQFLLVLIICCYCLWDHSIVFRGRQPPPTPQMFVLLESKIDFPKPHPWKPKRTNPLNLGDGLFCPVPISHRGCVRTRDTPKAQSKHTRLLILEKPDGGLSSSRC